MEGGKEGERRREREGEEEGERRREGGRERERDEKKKICSSMTKSNNFFFTPLLYFVHVELEPYIALMNSTIHVYMPCAIDFS